MAFYDLSLDELKVYQPQRSEPADFDAFWARNLAEARAIREPARFEPADFGLKTVSVYDVTFPGFAGQPIKGWYMLPAGTKESLPVVIEYIGYGGGRGFPTDWLFWPSMGYAFFVMDTRGQGSTWRHGDTPDVDPEGGNAQAPGFCTRGILNPQTAYFRRLYTDAVRAIDAAASAPFADATRLVVTGGSQAGGLSLVAAGLEPRLVAAMPDVPFMCHFRRATQITDSYPYQEIVTYCKVHRDKVEQVFANLDYFDGVNFAARGKAKALFSVGLMDDVCPPSTVYAAYNHYAGAKEMRIYTYNRHEGGDTFQMQEKRSFLKELLGL